MHDLGSPSTAAGRLRLLAPLASLAPAASTASTASLAPPDSLTRPASLTPPASNASLGPPDSLSPHAAARLHLLAPPASLAPAASAASTASLGPLAPPTSLAPPASFAPPDSPSPDAAARLRLLAPPASGPRMPRRVSQERGTRGAPLALGLHADQLLVRGLAPLAPELSNTRRQGVTNNTCRHLTPWCRCASQERGTRDETSCWGRGSRDLAMLAPMVQPERQLLTRRSGSGKG